MEFGECIAAAKVLTVSNNSFSMYFCSYHISLKDVEEESLPNAILMYQLCPSNKS